MNRDGLFYPLDGFSYVADRQTMLITLSLSFCFCLSFFLDWVQELEMQARAHGLTTDSSDLCSAELSARGIKQEPALGDFHQDLYPVDPQHQHHPACTPDQVQYTTLELNDGASPYTKGHGGVSGDQRPYGGHLKGALMDILMDDTLSPVRGGDPLLSSVSPGASKDSSCSGSKSMEENDQSC